MQQKNTPAIRMHFQGAVAVVEKHGSPYKMGRLAQKIVASFVCWTSYAPQNPGSLLVPFSTLVWSSSLHFSSDEDTANIVETHSDSLYPLISRPNHIDEFSLRTSRDEGNNAAQGLTYPTPTSSPPLSSQNHLQNKRTLSPALCKAVGRIAALSLLARRARHSSLSHQELADLMAGICCGGQRLASINPLSLSPLEDCIRMTTLIHFFADIVPFEEADEPPITYLTESVQARLSSIDLEVLLREWPERLLWISIIVGVFAQAGTWTFFQNLLRLTCRLMKILRWDDVTDVLDSIQPISSEPFLRCCKSFWLSSQALKSIQIELSQISGHDDLVDDCLNQF